MANTSPLKVHNVLPKYKNKEERNKKLQQAYINSLKQIYHMKTNAALSLKIKWWSDLLWMLFMQDNPLIKKIVSQ